MDVEKLVQELEEAIEHRQAEMRAENNQNTRIEFGGEAIGLRRAISIIRRHAQEPPKTEFRVETKFISMLIAATSYAEAIAIAKKDGYTPIEEPPTADAGLIGELEALAAKWDVDDNGLRRSFCVQELRELIARHQPKGE